MESKGTIALPIIGYILAIIIPILGLVFGAALFFLKKDVPLYRRHGRFIIYASIVIWIISFILRASGIIPV